MFFQEITPDTSGYMIAGYVISFLVMGLYVASIYLRGRNLRQDMAVLEEMDESAARSEPNRPAGAGGGNSPTPVTKKSTRK